MSEVFQKATLDLNAARSELHDLLSLTGAEVSLNNLPAGAAVPFVHAHKQNEEIYIVLSGSGELYIDGKVESLKAGDVFRIAPQGRRAIRAAADDGIKFLCIQCAQNSLKEYTNTDGVMCENEKAPWH